MKKLTLWMLWLGYGMVLRAQESVDAKANAIIRTQGMEHSRIAYYASKIVDEYGPRLTGSDRLKKAGYWLMDEAKRIGLENVQAQAWGPFGRGWELTHFEMHADAPGYFPVIAYPKAWSPSSAGLVSGELIYLNAATEAELSQYKGKLAGKIVLLDTIREVKEWFEASAERYKSEELLDLANSPAPQPFAGRGNLPRNFAMGSRPSQKIWELIYSEKPLAVLDRGFKGDLGTVFATGARARTGSAYAPTAEVIPQFTVAIEHYNRLFRAVMRNETIRLAFDLQVKYTNPGGMESNYLADIPGSVKKEELVIFGAHLDSWHLGTGATDNGAGTIVMLEAARILKETYRALGSQPKRSLRLALWTGEEQGLLGSRAYVNQRLVTRDSQNNILANKPEQEMISAYYNLDNGTGKLRGVYLQGNEKIQPIFRAWLEPWKDLGANTLSLQNTGGTDHLAFDGVGVPGFQFIQDEISYASKTHHSNMDLADHLLIDDLKQAATIIASLVYHTAEREERLPRKAQPPLLH
jgi:carboxypeptidase Q